MEIVILVGLQASGKSTFYRSRFSGTHLLVSKDPLRNARNRQARQAKLLDEALQAGRSVVVDNTNASPAERAPLIQQARAAGAEVVGYFFDTPLEECLERNRRRSGRERVPDVALYATNKRLQPPRMGEGFDRLYRVRLVGQEGDEVAEWVP